MKPVSRALITAAAMVVVAGLGMELRSLVAEGLFTHVRPGFSGNCKAVTGIEGPEDLQIDAQDGLVFISATDRRAKHPDPRDGIYTMDLAHGRLTRLVGMPPDFHPHGLSLYRDPDGGLTLMVIDHHAGDRSTVDIFGVTVLNGAARLKLRESVEGGLLVHPNDVAAVGPDTFYVTNDSTSRSAMGRAFETYALLPRGDVVYFNGSVFRIVASGLDFANGIQVSHDGAHVYVATTTGRALFTYERNPFSGSLTQVNSLSIASGLDNIDIDAKGNLWVAGHPRLLQEARFRRDPHDPAASQIFKVTMGQGVPQSAVPVYTNAGNQIGDASIGALIGKRLIIGSGLDDKLLDCTLK
jgi:arylesterase/paraoxonase